MVGGKKWNYEAPNNTHKRGAGWRDALPSSRDLIDFNGLPKRAPGGRKLAVGEDCFMGILMTWCGQT